MANLDEGPHPEPKFPFGLRVFFKIVLPNGTLANEFFPSACDIIVDDEIPAFVILSEEKTLAIIPCRKVLMIIASEAPRANH